MQEMYSLYLVENYQHFNQKGKNMNKLDFFTELKNELIEQLNIIDKKSLISKIEITSFSENILFHSKSLAYNYSPFFKEMTGYSLDKLKQGIPNKITNCCLYFGESDIEKIEHYGKTGKLTGTDYIIYGDSEKEIISLDNFDEFVKYIKVSLQNNIPIKSLQVTDRDNASLTLFLYEDSRIIKSFSIILFNGSILESEERYEYLDEDLVKIYATIDGEEECLYNKS